MDRNAFKFTFEDGSEALAHHGVKGMKWGVRKARDKMTAGGGGGVPMDDEEDLKTDYEELIRELSADGDKGFEEAAKMILDQERGKGNYDNDTLTDYIEIMREWSYDGDAGFKKAAEMIYDRERERPGAKSASELAKQNNARKSVNGAALSGLSVEKLVKSKMAKDKKLPSDKEVANIKKSLTTKKNPRLDATKYGMKDNSAESQQAVYSEQGLNPKMSRSQGTKTVLSNAKKYYSESPSKYKDVAKLGRAIVTGTFGMAKSVAIAQTLEPEEKK